MTLKVLELHHLAARIAPGPDAAGAALRFYGDVLGLECDHVPWDRAGESQRINAGANAQIHLISSAPKGTLAAGEFDLSSPHLAFPSPVSTRPRRSLTGSPLPTGSCMAG